MLSSGVSAAPRRRGAATQRKGRKWSDYPGRTGEYRGGVYRDDAALKAWLAKRPTEAALEPDLPIIDPHHHFWDTPQRGHYLLPELLADIGGGHNIVSTVFLECRAMYRKAAHARWRRWARSSSSTASRR